MIIVDRGVWVDYFIGNKTREVSKLDSLLGKYPIGTSELIYTDVLSGLNENRDFETAVRLFSLLTEVDMVTPKLAINSAENARFLRTLNIFIRNSLDLMIATYCIQNNYPLLFNRQNFVHFVEHLNLRNAVDI